MGGLLASFQSCAGCSSHLSCKTFEHIHKQNWLPSSLPSTIKLEAISTSLLFSGIIFTSPRCVQAVMNAEESTNNLERNWKESLVFSVGETTARLVQDNLHLSSEGSSAGNGKTLAPMILESEL